MNRTQRAYIYGITDLEATAPENITGIGDLSVGISKLPLCDFALVTSDLPPDYVGLEFEDTVKHVRVLESLMNQTITVIPVRLGTVSQSLSDLERSLQNHKAAIAKELQRFKGMSELGVKAYWKKDRVKQELARYPEYPSLVAKAQSDRNAAIELGQWVEKVVEEWRNHAKNQIHEPLRKHAADAASGEINSVEMIYNGSFLVDSNQSHCLQQALEGLAAKFGDRYDFHCTTHLPPYNFVNLKINWSHK